VGPEYAGRAWVCDGAQHAPPDGDNKGGDDVGWPGLVLFFVLAPNLAVWTAVLCICAGCHRRSMARPPFSGGPVKGFARRAAAAPAPASVQCPADAGPGSELQVQLGGRLVGVVVPAGVGPGQVFSVPHYNTTSRDL
jgi:hypothetical protein